jgi:ferredoxin-thioredoxin reductase catalytic subunit
VVVRAVADAASPPPSPPHPLAEPVNGRLYLVPGRGLLERMRPVILGKLNGGEKAYAKGLDIPRYRPIFVELVVEDDCGACPLAVEFVSELVAGFENVSAAIYNATYVEPPFEVDATPAFRVNGRVSWTGVPLTGDFSFVEELFKEAYVRAHPELPKLLERLRTFAEANNLVRHPNTSQFKSIVYKLLVNLDRYGRPYCPCRPLTQSQRLGATREVDHELNKDKECPCVHAAREARERGHCLCGLFWSKEAVERYVRERAEKYAHAIKAIEEVERAFSLSELKARVVTGESRRYLEAMMRGLERVYALLPED